MTVPWGGVLTLPATGSEMNANSVICRESTQEKLEQLGARVFGIQAGAGMGERGAIGQRAVRDNLRLRVGA